MSNQDKFFEQFKEAAHQVEQHRFPGFDDVWQKVEERLDGKEKQPKVFWLPLRKWIAVAAVLLVFVFAGIAIWPSKNETPKLAADNGLNKRPAITQPAPQPLVRDTQVPAPASASAALAQHKSSQQKEPVQPIVAAVKQPAKAVDSNLAQVSLLPTEPPLIFGRVTDDKGKPVAHSSVYVKGTNIGTATDSLGQFKIKAQPGETLAVASVGFEAANFVAIANKQAEVKLKPATTALNDVVVVGYAAAKKREMAGAAAAVLSKQQMQNAKAMSINQALQGRVAGVQTRGVSPNPGAATQVHIRGLASVSANSKPLVIVNGIPAPEGVLSSLSPTSISNVTVLKDSQATALYGSRAQNGVVLITTNQLSKKEQRKLNKLQEQMLKSGINVNPVTPLLPIVVPEQNEDYNPLIENPFTSPQVSPLSTFSIDVDNASYANIRRFIQGGQPVPQDAVRIEEMLNYFRYQYQEPAAGKPFGVQTEYSDAPWNAGHKLLRIALKAKDIPQSQLPASNLVFLIDVSGSMNAYNKLPLLKTSMKVLVNQLREEDKVSIVVYAGAAGLVLPPTDGSKKQIINDAIEKLSAGGSTAGGAGIELAYATAQANFIKGGNNRVIIATDGDFNVGISSAGDLQRMIEEKRKTGIFLTCLGFGMGNYKDHQLETLADKGNGNYAYIDNQLEANRFLGKEFKGSMFAVAKDVKLQIEFNPAQVKSYRLIGYENRKLNNEDFVNDSIDAGEMGAGHAVTALYEIIPAGVESSFAGEVPVLKYGKTFLNNAAAGELCNIKMRYKQPDANNSIEWVKPVPVSSVALTNSSEDFRFATAVAWFGLKLRKSALISTSDKAKIVALAKSAITFDPEGYRSEFIRLVEASQ